MASPVGSRKSSQAIERQGHTAGPYGLDPTADPKGKADNAPRDLKA